MFELTASVPRVVAEGRLFVANRQSMVAPAALRSSS